MPECTKEDLKILSVLIQRPIRFSAYEKAVQYTWDADSVAIKTHVLIVEETRREWKITKSGIRLYGWTRTESGPWDCALVHTVWNESFIPIIHVKVGKIMTFSEAREQMWFERDCARPGSDRFPMDSWMRTVEDTEAPVKMDKHWGYTVA